MTSPSFPRPLSASEQDVLRAAVAVDVHDPAAVTALHAQIAVAQVLGPSCPCGCPSYALRVPGSAPSAAVGEFSAGTPGGGMRIVLDDGYLADVELYWHTEDVPTAWPPADALS